MDPSKPGFENIIIKPHVLGDLKHVSASVNAIRGTVSSSWKKDRDSLVLEVTIPVNSTGKVSVPTLGLKKPKVKEGERVVWKDGSFVKGTDGVVSEKRKINMSPSRLDQEHTASQSLKVTKRLKPFVNVTNDQLHKRG